ncbi:HNH endonuclease, partial [Clostridium beijerinckii]
SASDDIIIKTPANVKVKAQSQIGVVKSGTENGLSVETDMHFKGSNVIKDGSDRETYAPFDDEPKAGTKPEPPAPPPEEKKGFNWGGLLVLAVAAVAVVASVVTFGIGAVLVGAAIGACVGAACAAVSTAVSDHINGTQSSLGTYAKNMLKGALTGAVSGAIFGPLGSFESLGGVMAFGGINGMADSVLNQAIDGKFSLKQTLLDGLIGAATGGLLHGAGKLISKVSPFVSKSIGNVLGKISGEAKSILGKISGKADDILGAFSKTSKELFNKVANKVDDVATSIKNSAQDLVDRAANKFNEVTTQIDNKIQDALHSVASKADDGLNVLNQARYNVRKAIGLEEEYAVPGGGYVNNAPEETSFFKDKVSNIIGNGRNVNIDKSELDKAVNEAMEKAARNQPKYTKKAIEPKKYKEKVYNDDGSVTYTLKKGGKEIKVTYDEAGNPIFNSKYNTSLPEYLYLAGDNEQFSFLSKELYENAMKDNKLKEMFTDEELQLFKDGKKPDSYTWHHHQKSGKMQLVDYYEHKAPHTGGRAYWGGGLEGRKGKIKKQIIEQVIEILCEK